MKCTNQAPSSIRMENSGRAPGDPILQSSEQQSLHKACFHCWGMIKHEYPQGFELKGPWNDPPHQTDNGQDDFGWYLVGCQFGSLSMVSRSFGFVVAVILSPFHMFPNVNIPSSKILPDCLPFRSLPSEPAMVSLKEITQLLTSAPNNPGKHTHIALPSSLTQSSLVPQTQLQSRRKCKRLVVSRRIKPRKSKFKWTPGS